ncbi:PREDICTED: uncharacterized protein LOC108764450 [Trachymyrmex cornetzi]|uniref:uncharacterized protein LOC108764450 n=1 Tax=Trachymyrmex cornetzi TaxID=471704 RepID=UPI00084F6C8C|nr:PREDICTED: uncharacterized protein LOC108764450 [Trachymyrmex cornetzi]
MGRISFDRRLLAKDHDDIQFHGFCDASGVGYGACLYIRSCGKDGDPTIRLACARSRVAPLKTVTIPRLELCGALLLARLYREAKEVMGIIPNDVVFWCDSTIVLHWIKTPHLLKTFVANRVAEIREITNPNAWRHVGSNDNPADAISRGQLPRIFVQNKIWFEGPSWLKREKGEWPNEITQSIQVLELRKNICLVTASDNLEMFKKYSSFSKLLRIIAYCLRWRPNNKWSGTLCATEISETEIRLLKMLQATRFANEIKTVNEKKELPGKNRLLSLSPFADENSLLRVGGRLQKSQLTFTQKHPILLPSQHWLTDRIIRETHETTTRTFNRHYIFCDKDFGYSTEKIRCEKLYEPVYAVFVSTRIPSSTKWGISRQLVSARQRLSLIQASTSAGLSISKRGNTATEQR